MEHFGFAVYTADKRTDVEGLLPLPLPLRDLDSRRVVPNVANGTCSRKIRGLLVVVEDVRDEAKAMDRMKAAIIIADGDADALLTAVLKRLECETAEAGGFPVTIDSHDTITFF